MSESNRCLTCGDEIPNDCSFCIQCIEESEAEELEKKAEEYAEKQQGVFRFLSDHIKLGFIAGAKAMQDSMKENKPLREFDINNVLTCTTVDRAKVGMKGYFADSLAELKDNFENSVLYELVEVCSEVFTFRFKAEHDTYALFYPVDEVEE